MNKLYRDITFIKDNIHRVKRYYTDRGNDREYYVGAFKASAETDIKNLIRILSKFY